MRKHTVFIMVLAIALIAVRAAAYQERCGIAYTVGSGDTLWEIVKREERYRGMDTRKVIYDIEQISETGAEVYPGQIIFLPIY